ncbi:GNAT family N-acetyltransferase [Catellatospora citrea]|uniref:N-acetyltransferase n=1 Tax=Catellatospora citrea TaxID=53366 RepID=A0A8J3P1G8_9ACTN|nr:GNAT family N-acetyltransferase [Catellatospora citrea]GIG00078.1 N-acetyltransferase [Catellatospora citrea]
MPNRIMMIRPHLDDLPLSELPEPYTIRWYRDGDAQHWTMIKSASDRHHHAPPDYHERIYGAYSDELRRRQAFVCDGYGEPVGTATAWWFENLDDSSLGKINWMLIAPHAQGRGLAKPLLAACCGRLASLGHTRAALFTLTQRLPAINLYRSFGFVPLIRHAADTQAWAATSALLRRPYAETDYLHATDLGIDVAMLSD